MRAIVLAMAGFGICVGLSACDQVPGPAPQQQAQAAPVAPPCNCQQPPEHLTRLSYIPRHDYGYRHHRRHAQYAGSGYDESYRARGDHGSYTSRSTESVDSYDYVSSSRSSRYAENDSAYGGGGYHGGGNVTWVDGYGRGYFDGAPPTRAASMNGRRMDVWHGYDADCPEGYGQDGY